MYTWNMLLHTPIRVRNSIIRERCGWELSVLERIERNMLKWFGDVERMGEERLVMRVHRANMDSNKD